MIMEEKINVAELLKDCPKGMELDCILYDNIYFDTVGHNSIKCYIQNKGYRTSITFDCYGGLIDSIPTKCVIFPKGKTTWEGFQRPFKDGDVIFTHANCLKVGLGNTWISIYQENRNGGVATYVDYAEDGSDYYSDIYGDKAFLCMENDILHQRLATEEEKQKLFDAIKANGYKWNAETKTLEKLIEPKFKVGNRVKKNKDYISGIVTDIFDDSFKVTYDGGCCSYVQFHYQHDWELVSDKFDITTLKPFDKVLVRDENLLEDSDITDATWSAAIYSHNKFIDNACPYVTTNGHFAQCVPYKGNEHLLGTTDDCDDYYKTWE